MPSASINVHISLMSVGNIAVLCALASTPYGSPARWARRPDDILHVSPGWSTRPYYLSLSSRSLETSTHRPPPLGMLRVLGLLFSVSILLLSASLSIASEDDAHRTLGPTSSLDTFLHLDLPRHAHDTQTNDTPSHRVLQ
ncbi:hypothetical protein EW146_g5120 [Bondarzewia mesenterica]|uniref:Uncharacterized protein n=1 Tax=Bondarzewia mesenterica TaxID=1095465 RepID=A0A4S4LSF4_9AGAM|nr:hypothetical protein EW146_g5120 [Bondarzewia mesenterica]